MQTTVLVRQDPEYDADAKCLNPYVAGGFGVVDAPRAGRNAWVGRLCCTCRFSQPCVGTVPARTCQPCVTCGEITLFGHATANMPLMLWVSECVLQQFVDAAPVFSLTMHGLHFDIACLLLLQVNVVVMRGINDDEMKDFVELTRHQPVNVRFIEYMPFDGNVWSTNKMVTYREMMQRVAER